MADEIAELFNNSINSDKVINEESIRELPVLVQKNLLYTQIIGKPRIATVRLKQKGLFKLKQGQKWIPVTAEQYFTTNPPGFVWRAKVKLNPLLWISGRDMYYQGKGNMRMKLWSIFKLSDSIGYKLDQGTLLRYLSEIIWFPTAYLSDYIKWETATADSVKVTMDYGGVSASAFIYYDEVGRFVKFTADRYMGADDNATLEKWTVVAQDYKEFNGIRIPVKGEVTWNLPSGDFTWAKLDITDIEYNNPFRY
ncbi:MAG: hypothetical protein PHQ86_04435 [Dehalococcoidales bacterium]|nr:hypothetical protein [Dehalococcoidales bacterium]